MISPAIRTVLLSSPEVAAMVGERVYPQLAPQGSDMPAVIYTIRREPLTVQEGLQGFDRYDLGVDCWSRQRPGESPYDEASSLAAAVVQALGGYRGTVEGIQIHGIVVEATYDDGADEETGIYSVGVDAYVWAQRAS